MIAREQVSTAKVMTYASNLQDTGSMRQYRDTMEGEYRKQIMWDTYAEERRANMVEQYGDAAADSIRRQGFGQLLSGAAQAGSTLARSGAFSRKPESPWAGSGELGYMVPGSGGLMSRTDPGKGSLLLKRSNY